MIVEHIQRPPADIVQGFRDMLAFDSITCAISDCLGRFNAMTSDMRPLFEGIRLVGTEVTVKTLAADLAAACKAIDLAQPGDVVDRRPQLREHRLLGREHGSLGPQPGGAGGGDRRRVPGGGGVAQTALPGGQQGLGANAAKHSGTASRTAPGS